MIIYSYAWGVPMRKVPVWALEEGMEVARPVYDDMGSMLLNQGMKLKNVYIQNLKRLGIMSIYVRDPLLEDSKVEDVILDDTRQKARGLIRGILKDIEKQPSIRSTQLLFTKKEVNTVLTDIIDQLMNNKDLMINLSDIRTSDGYTFSHCVNVAVLSLTTALSMKGFNRPKLETLGLGAILHDLGKVRIPMTILNKKGKLTADEYDEVKKHPQYSKEILKGFGFNSLTSTIVYQHHERLDGSGYPRGIGENDIHEFAKICAVSDVYDAMVADRPYRLGFPPHKAFQVLQSSGDTLDQTVLHHFFKHIAAYPIGTFVGLSSGQIGVVTHNTVGFAERPRVRLFAHKEEKEFFTPYDVDLMEKIDVVVDEVYNERQLPKRIVAQARACV